MLPLIGPKVDRVDGRKKVTGAAQYAAEFPLPNLCHGVLVPATIAKGRITVIDVAAAKRLPGVVAVLCYVDEQQRLARVPPSHPGGNSQTPGSQMMLSDRVSFYGQPIAIIVAERLEQAQHAARSLAVTYAPEPVMVDIDAGLKNAKPPKNGKAKDEPAATKRGDPDGAYAAAAVKTSQSYGTPHEAHNPMEMHATTATWSADGKLTLYDATQGVEATKKAAALAMGVDEASVRTIDPFVGGGFGSKGTTWPHTALTALAAQHVNRPVRLVLARDQTFFECGYRSPTRQQVDLAAAGDGTLAAFRHDSVSQTPTYSQFLETAALPTRHLYACPNASTSHKMVEVDTSVPSQMRAPGEATGLFAFEVAMDELAVALNMDPVELRLKNNAEKDPEDGKPFSSKSVEKCYRQAADKFGWSKRSPKPRSMTDGRLLVGYGMATAMYPANRQQASATVTAFADGSVTVRSATQDIGTGTYTIMAQLVADELGLPPTAVRSLLGDTTFPKASVSGGSTTAASVGTAIQLAAAKLREQLVDAAVNNGSGPLHGVNKSAVKLADGKLTGPDGKADTIRDVVRRSGGNSMAFTATPEMFEAADKTAKQFSRYSFGAVFAEVHVDPDLGMIRVPRLVAAYAAGRILNAQTARSQFLGGLCFAHGMALLEEATTDARTGKIVNANLAEYLVPTHADVESVEVIQVPEEDPHVNPIGVKGVGEIGIVGGPAAIANAIYHATGKRVRSLPITPDKLL